MFSEVQVHFSPHLIIVFFFSNESVCITTGDEPGNVYGGGYEKHTACIYCTLWFGCAFPVFLFIARVPKKLWILFSDTVLSTRVVNISPAQKRKPNKQTNDMFCSFTTNKKVLLFYFHVFCFYFRNCILYFFFCSSIKRRTFQVWPMED